MVDGLVSQRHRHGWTGTAWAGNWGIHRCIEQGVAAIRSITSVLVCTRDPANADPHGARDQRLTKDSRG